MKSSYNQILQYFVLVLTIGAMSSCAFVNYQSIALSKDGSFNVSGSEAYLLTVPKAIVLQCVKETELNYVCEKKYPADGVDIFANPTMKR